MEAPGEHRLRRLRRVVAVAVAANLLIVFSGGLVRVTGSGLGCPDWPTCEGTRVTPGGAHAGWQTFVEFGNRLLTFAVLAAVVAALVGVRRTRPHPRGIVALAWALVIGVLTQAVVGGVTVLTGLNPWTVAIHFLLSIGLIGVAVVLHERLRPHEERAGASAALQHLTTAVVIAALMVLVLGTLVTGAGPHGGDPGATRLPLEIRFTAIAHADAVWLLVGLTVATVVASRSRAPTRFSRTVRLLLAVQLLQGGVGYLQYALGVPPALVALHILGAVTVWTLAVAAWSRARPWPDPRADA